MRSNNTATGEWRPGPPLPEAVARGASVPHGDTFLVLGGVTAEGEGEGEGPSSSPAIYEYEYNGSWILREDALLRGGAGVPAAVVVPGDRVGC